MPTIQQLRQDIANNETELTRCSGELEYLNKQCANQQRKVTIKENKINDFSYKPNLTAVESEKLATLTRELFSDKQELDNRERARATCSSRETGLLFKIADLKMELSELEASGAIDYSSRSFRR